MYVTWRISTIYPYASLVWTRLYTREGHVRVSFPTSDRIQRVQVVDILPDVNNSDLQDTFPNVKCVRILASEQYDALPVVCSTLETIIHLVHPERLAVHFKISNVAGPQTRKCIAVLPSDLSKVRADSVSWPPSSSSTNASVERVLVFELNNALEGILGHRPQHRLSIEAIAPLTASSRRFTVVGCEQYLADTRNSGFSQALDGKCPINRLRDYFLSFRYRGSVKGVRFLSIEEWRSEITDHEWELVASLPDACQTVHKLS